LPPVNFDFKEEKLQLKSTITFLALKAVGQLVKFFMLSSYRRVGANYDLDENQRVLYEGIFTTSSINSGEILLRMVEESVYSP
jgi:hypothetical protein